MAITRFESGLRGMLSGWDLQHSPKTSDAEPPDTRANPVRRIVGPSGFTTATLVRIMDRITEQLIPTSTPTSSCVGHPNLPVVARTLGWLGETPDLFFLRR